MEKEDKIRFEEMVDTDVARRSLIAGIARWAEDCMEFKAPIPGLFLYRHDKPSEPCFGLYDPSICLVAQGVKKAYIENEIFIYDANNYLLTSVHLPTTFQVITASPEKPYLGLVLKFDMKELSQLMIDSNLLAPGTRPIEYGMSTSEVTLPLLSAFQRLISLLDEPESIPILAPIIHREILYRLLIGEQGARLRQIASAGSRSHQVARAVEWLKTNYSEQLKVEQLAEMANMSSSSFHNHFRSMTSLSPLQYQKQLRLQEARRLMLAEDMDATRAAFQVGYESSSQFSREYSRFFGAPPLRDVSNLRKVAS